MILFDFRSVCSSRADGIMEYECTAAVAILNAVVRSAGSRKYYTYRVSPKVSKQSKRFPSAIRRVWSGVSSAFCAGPSNPRAIERRTIVWPQIKTDPLAT